MSQKIFDNDLNAIGNGKVTSTLNKVAMLAFAYCIWSNYWCTSSIITTLKINMATTQDYYLLRLIVWCTKLKLKTLWRC